MGRGPALCSSRSGAVRAAHVNEPTRPVKYHTLTEHKHKLGVFADTFPPVSESRWSILPSAKSLRIHQVTSPQLTHSLLRLTSYFVPKARQYTGGSGSPYLHQLIPSQSVSYPKAGNALVTALKSRISMDGGDHLYSGDLRAAHNRAVAEGRAYCAGDVDTPQPRSAVRRRVRSWRRRFMFDSYLTNSLQVFFEHSSTGSIRDLFIYV
ncbi:hypothetical protein EVAR_7104_1 [Eumeta japonica]|uniref:Uncharacterized protein n=1 Tax=Eumeta variegata TaxID=151549 RepID=A0A4C1YBU9_EUMVA|nr:hypothetical protein EVAR_7104_1 [Eumeta japonica]